MLDRDRIADDLRDKVVQRLFAAGLTLQSAVMRTADPDMRHRIDKSIDELDDAIKVIRDTVYGLEHRLAGRGLRAEILHLCEELQPAPELSFSGPVDGALPPGAGAGVAQLLREAVGLIGQHFVPTRIAITARGDSYTAVVEATPMAGATRLKASPEFFSLQDIAAQAGIGMDIEPGSGSTRFAWHVPVSAAR
jgi:signal transduction histidine kinase